jgi:hypothetical protein
MSTSEKKSRAAEADAFEPTVAEFPTDAGVVLAFHGLMCFCHNTVEDRPFCEIGIHTQAPNHTFRMTVLKVGTSFDPPASPDYTALDEGETYLEAQTGSSPTSLITFKVNNPRIPEGVHYFKRGQGSGKGPNDFSRVPDLESPDFYGEFLETMPGGERFLPKLVNAFGPVVRVTDGLFYTRLGTKFKTKRRAKDNPETHVRRLGRVAEVVGANIYLGAEGSVDLITQSGTRTLKPTGDYKYLVLIDNLCPREDCPDTDFNLYDSTFDKPAAAPRLELVRDDEEGEGDEEKSANDAARAAFFANQKQLLNPEEHKSNDDSPCGASGFGTSGCLICS